MIVLCVMVCIVFAILWLLEYHRRQKMYHAIDCMIDDILNRKPSDISDVQEGQISALAGKMNRLYCKVEQDIVYAQNEKEQVKELISDMSHQLKTPLSNLMMYEELLNHEMENEKNRAYFLQKITQQTEKIDWILQSLFKMVRLEQGAISFEATKTSIKETLLMAVNAVYEKAEKNRIEIITKPFEDCCLLHNRKWTVEVFVNLLENAIKYSKQESHIIVQVNPLELYTEIQIIDQGIGIQPEEIEDIWKRFYRSKEVEQKEGSGIGLYLSRLILEQEKGYITVKSEYGIGSCFSVFLQNCHNG